MVNYTKRKNKEREMTEKGCELYDYGIEKTNTLRNER